MSKGIEKLHQEKEEFRKRLGNKGKPSLDALRFDVVGIVVFRWVFIDCIELFQELVIVGAGKNSEGEVRSAF